MFRLREGRDPGAIAHHDDERCAACDLREDACLCVEFAPACTGADYLDENDKPIPDEDLPEDFDACAACSYQLELATEIIAVAGDLRWLERALAAFSLESSIADYGLSLDSITAIQLHDLDIVKAERRMFEAQKQYQDEQASKRGPG